jgi:pimeloyl-ACP methyl ester carboxylesterase
VAGSLGAGLATALCLPFAPFVPADETVVTGVVLLGFAFGWALLAGLSMWFSDQPQRWAVAPAVFMGMSGGIVIVGPDSLGDGVLGWVWPPALLALVIWMFLRSRRELHSWTRPWLLYPVLAALVLLALGGGFERVGRSVDAPASAMRGQLVDVGPYRLHLECSGRGRPTVVLEPGGGEMSAMLGWVEPAVARDTRVCVYDRPGRGWSDPAATPPDGAQTAADLRTLLRRADVPGPYVLAGHSFGGLYVMSFAAQFPQDVAGLVLVDSTAPISTPVARQRADSYDLMGRVSALVAASSRLGLGRLNALTSYSGLPPRSRDDARASAATADHLGSFVDEYAVASRSTREAGQLVGLDAKPLVVLTAGRGSDAEWLAAQQQLARLSTNSRHQVVAGAVHASLLEDRDDATAVTDAVLDVVAAVRTGTPLPAR